MTFANVSALAVVPAAAAPAPVAAPSTNDDGELTFHDLLDIVNPLQHLPIISTIYRAITGETIKTFPKIAGDTLYGGVTGFASSIADTIFTKITGKSVGDTVLGWLEDEFSPAHPSTPQTGVASTAAPAALAANIPITNTQQALAAPTALTPLAAPDTARDSIVVPGQDALLQALTRNGVSQDVALRAADAYRRTLNGPAASAANATLH